MTSKYEGRKHSRCSRPQFSRTFDSRKHSITGRTISTPQTRNIRTIQKPRVTVLDVLMARALARAAYGLDYSTTIEAARRLAALSEGRAL